MIGEILRLQIFSDRKVVESRPLARVILLQREVDDRGGQNVAAVVDANDLRRLLVAVGDDADCVGAWSQQPKEVPASPARYLVIDLFDLFEMKKRESKIKHGQERPKVCGQVFEASKVKLDTHLPVALVVAHLAVLQEDPTAKVANAKTFTQKLF